uniref:hypothetical protein n=1 Tax=Fodinicola feengrottensis TaxID=435914 RepID=UPI0036F1AF5A
MSGTVTTVVDALTADYFVVPAEGPALFVVAAADVTRSPIVTLDPTRPLADVTLEKSARPANRGGRRCRRSTHRGLAYGRRAAGIRAVGRRRARAGNHD